MVKPIVCGTLGDQSSNFHQYRKQLSVSIDTNTHHKAEENIYLQIEPEELINHDWLVRSYSTFQHILCWEEKLLCLPNAKLFPFGTCWVDPTKNYKKEFAISNLCGNKSMLDGHRIRREAYITLNSIPYKKLNIMSPPRIESKEILFDGFEFSIIIENIVKKNWFTEKLIDCLVTNTIPIYYGCPNIGNFFDDSYFLKFNTIPELKHILLTLTPEYYNTHIQKIEKNKQSALVYVNLWNRLNTILDGLYE